VGRGIAALFTQGLHKPSVCPQFPTPDYGRRSLHRSKARTNSSQVRAGTMLPAGSPIPGEAMVWVRVSFSAEAVRSDALIVSQQPASEKLVSLFEPTPR
jgi:hypothetical protein